MVAKLLYVAVRYATVIAIIDYGMGNLRSIAKALEYVGGNVRVTGDPAVIREAERIVLPGVGAFGEGMANLRLRGLDSALTEEIMEKRKPFLGICLGMQLIAKRSGEFGTHEGLGWMDAEVLRFAFPADASLPRMGPLRIPHVGWNAVRFVREHPLTAGLNGEEDFYFVHSYHLVPHTSDVIAGTCDYGGNFVAMVAKDNIFATQFHPEKSQKAGLTMLKNFLSFPSFDCTQDKC